MYDRLLCRVYSLHHGGGLSMPKIYHMNAKTSKISQSLFNHKQCLSIELFCQHASTTSVQKRAILTLLHQRMDYLQIHSIPKVSNILFSQRD